MRAFIEDIKSSVGLSPQPVQWKYEPREDITTYELAKLMPYLVGRYMTEATWQMMGSEQRHLVRLPNNEHE